jgi:Tol biopolymer transport system component
MKTQLFHIDPFDRYMVAVIAVILLAIGAVVVYGDHVGVEILEVGPADGQQTGTNVEIKITFDQAMDKGSVQARFRVKPAVEGSFRWRSTTLIFTPDPVLRPGETYTVTLKQGAKSITGRSLKEDLRWSFSTRAAIARVYYLSPANVVDRSLWAVGIEDPTPHKVFSAPYGIFDFEPAPNGLEIAVTAYGRGNLTTNLWMIDADGSSPRQLLDCAPGACGRPAWSPDSKLIAYERQTLSDAGGLAPSRVWLLDVGTGQTAPIFEDSQVLGYQATWAPTGRIVSFYDSNASGIRIINLETQETQIVQTQLSERWSFSPDGKILSYTDLRLEGRFYYAQLWTVELGSSEAERRTMLAVSEEDQEPVWSPDGQWVAFRRRRVNGPVSNGWQVMLYNSTTQEIRQLTNDTDYTSRNMRWYPDSRWMVFQRYSLVATSAQAEIWIYDMATDEVRPLAADAFNPRWLTS